MKRLEEFVDNCALRDELEPNKPTLPLPEQPWWLRVVIKFLRIGGN
jgi:hypothetical protein